MSETLRDLCATTRELSRLQQAVKEDLQEVRASQKAANELLVELQGAHEAKALVDGACYTVAVVVKATRPQQPLSIIERLQEQWLGQGAEEWRRLVSSRPDQDPVESLLELAVDKAWPDAKLRRSFAVKRVSAASERVSDLADVPPSSLPLLESYLQAKQLVSQRLSSVREERKELAQKKSELEDAARKELATLPEQSFRKIQFTSSERQTDCYYLKLKPPRKPPPPKISFEKLKRLLKAWIGEHFDVSLRPVFIDAMSKPDVVEGMMRDVSLQYQEMSKKPEKPRIYMKNIKEEQL